MIDLEAAMQESGIVDRRAREIADTFQYWLDEGAI